MAGIDLRRGIAARLSAPGSGLKPGAPVVGFLSRVQHWQTTHCRTPVHLRHHTDAWWSRNVVLGVITASFDNAPGDRGDAILNDIGTGDWVLASYNGYTEAERMKKLRAAYKPLTTVMATDGIASAKIFPAVRRCLAVKLT